jgi:2-dehydro-3-deoxyphosphogalactonate aldolase
MKIDDLLAQGGLPIVAILRGVETSEAVAVAEALVEAGIRIIEVPFNSPDPVGSIGAMAQALGDRAAIGGGTVTSAVLARALAEAGGSFMVSPNVHRETLAEAQSLGLDLVPGFLTPTEAFAAVEAGAADLKLFPGSVLGSGYVKAIREVLPRHVRIWAVGGVGADNVSEWRAAGVFGIGVGGGLFRPGDDVATVAQRARALVAAWGDV